VASVVQDLVVDIGDVADKGDVVAALSQPAPHYVERHSAADVPNVWRPLDGGPAHVHTHSSIAEGHEFADAARRGVVELNRHGATVPGQVSE